MALGILPLLSTLNIVSIAFDSWVGKVAIIFAYLAAFAGIYLIIDSFHEIGSMAPFIGWVTLIAGLLVFAFGLLTLLVSWNVFAWSWWPDIPPIFYYAVFILEGILLFIAGFLD